MATRLQTLDALRTLDQPDVNTPALRPVAAPVDTFVQTRGGEQLSQLARGLASLAPSVARFADQTAERDAEKGKQQGAADAREWAASQKTYADARKAGKINEAQDPWYRLGFKETMGQLSAYKFSSDFQNAAQRQLADSTDVKQFDDFAQKFRSDWLKQSGADAADLGFSNGFGPLSDSLLANARSAFVNAAGSKLKQQTYEAHAANLTHTIDTELDAGTSRDAIGEALHMLTGRALAFGMDATTANQAAITAIADVARSRGDVTILDLMKKIGAGSQSLYDRPTARDVYDKVSEEISTRKTQADNLAWQQEQKARTERVRATYTAAAQKLFAAGANAGNVDISADLQTLAKDDPATAENLQQLRQSVVSASYGGNDQLFSQEVQNLLTVTDPSDPRYLTVQHVGNMVGPHGLSAAQAFQLTSTIKVLREKPPAEKDPFDVFGKAYSQLSGAYGGDMNITGEVARMRTSALDYMVQQRVQMEADGSWERMSLSDRQAKLDAITETALKRWKPIVDPEDIRPSDRSHMTDFQKRDTAGPVRSDATKRGAAAEAIVKMKTQAKAELAAGHVSQETVNAAAAAGYVGLDAIERWANEK